MDATSNGSIILSQSKQIDFDLYSATVFDIEEDFDQLDISDSHNCHSSIGLEDNEEETTVDIEIEIDDQEVVNDPITAEEVAIMETMGLPTAFKSSKRPFYDNDFSSGHESDSTVSNKAKTRRKTKKQKKKKISKYWAQRYRLFSRFDEGIKLDQESWYSVTPERIAQHIASRCVKPGYHVIMDPFCGVGGNTIQFALASENVFVIASDIDPKKIEMAKHNATVYGVQHRINFIVADFFQIINNISFKVDSIFLSPPWGGPNYLSEEKYSLSMMSPDGFDIYKAAKEHITPNIAFLLPRNIDKDELNSLLEPDQSVEVEQNLLNKKPKTITAYFGNLISTA